MSLIKKWYDKIQVEVRVNEAKSLRSGPTCLLIVAESKKQLVALAKNKLQDSQISQLEKSSSHHQHFQNEKLQIVTLFLETPDTKTYGVLNDSLRAYVRNKVGTILSGKCGQAEVILDADSKNAEDITKGIVEAVTLGAYCFKNTNKTILNLYLPKTLLEVAHQAWLKADAVNFARYLVDLPPNELNPSSYVKLIQDLTKAKKNFKTTVISKDLDDQGYGLITAVGKGSEHLPALVKVVYSKAPTKRKAENTIAFVGKGITFDTGGLDLKPSNFMRLMKKDMGGSAAVMGVMYYHINTTPDADIDFYLAIAENSVDAVSFRPGDIYTSGNGISVEIHNTDAEGRLVLADALAWMGKDKTPPAIVIDLATLTGAIKAGLGAYVGGLFSNDKKLSDSLYDAAFESGDHLWPMPMPYWTEDEIKKTPVADLVNATDGYGGAITAAQFLKQFVPKKSKWAHLDIYAWVDSARGPFKQKGGSGQAVFAVIDWLEKNRPRS